MKRLGWTFAGFTVMAVTGAVAMLAAGVQTPELAVTVAKALAKGVVIGIAELIQCFV